MIIVIAVAVAVAVSIAIAIVIVTMNEKPLNLEKTISSVFICIVINL